MTTTITSGVFSAITVQVLGTPSTSSASWADGVTLSVNNGMLICGNFAFTTTVVTFPPTYVDATMNSMFKYSTSGSTSTLSVSPTVVAQVGSYTATTTACLVNSPTICATSLAYSLSVLYCSVTGI